MFDPADLPIDLGDGWYVQNNEGSGESQGCQFSWVQAVEGNLSIHDFPPYGNNWRDPLDRIISTLRIFENGVFQIRFVQPASRGIAGQGMAYYRIWSPSGKEKHLFIPGEKKEILQNHFKNFFNQNLLGRYSIRAFTNYYFHPRYVDRFMAIAISLDGLLFTPTEPRRNGQQDSPRFHKFAMRLAQLLDDNHQENDHAVCLEFVAWRNKIAHGTGQIDETDQFWELSDKFESKCRDLIKILHEKKVLFNFHPNNKIDFGPMNQLIMRDLQTCNCDLRDLSKSRPVYDGYVNNFLKDELGI